LFAENNLLERLFGVFFLPVFQNNSKIVYYCKNKKEERGIEKWN